MTSTGKRRLASPWRVSALVLVAAISIGASAVGTFGRESAEPRTVTAVFQDASPLLPANDVKVDGVKVGEVSAIYVSGKKAKVSFTISPEALPLHRDARVSVRPVSLLGERYLDLDRGSPSKPVLKDGLIPVSRTSRSTDLDQVLNVLDDPTSESLAALVTVLGQGIQGNGHNIAKTVKALAPAMDDTGGLVEVLNKQNGTLNQLVDNVKPVADSLAKDNGRTLDRLVASTHDVLATTQANEAAIRATLRQLPSTLNEARATFRQLTGTAGAAVPTLKAIRPTTDNLTTISQEITRFSASADPALVRAKPVLDKARSLLDQARPVARELREAGPPLRSVAASARPLVNKLAGNFNNVMNFIRGWALATNGADGIGHYFRAMTIISPKMASGMLPALSGQNLPNGVGTDARKRPDNGGDAAPQPGPSGLLAPKASLDGGVTGLTAPQESGALGLLLGGGK